jgi:hypothetical protein
MKRYLIRCFLFISFFAVWSNSLNAAVYEASTLHNAVSRSETVQDLFFKRWDLIQEQELYFDFYGKLNWVHGFKINTINKGTGEKEAVDMRLIRTYGSITVNYPVLGGYQGSNLAERTSGKAKKEEEGGLWKPKNLILGFTATGFHYGLTSESTVDRGDAGSETVSDYKYTQFFDDIFALSLLYRPYFYIHCGMLINNQIEPDDDGTMDYTDSSGRTTRYFIASNLLSFLNLNATTTSGELEAFAIGLIINNSLKFFMTPPKIMPRITITYKKLALYRDEAYDPVWVITGTGKSGDIPDSQKQEADLDTLSILLEENLGNKIFVNGFIEFQKPSETLVDKRTVTSTDLQGDKVTYDYVREAYFSIGYNFLKASSTERLVATVGISRFWDVAIPVHRESGSGYSLKGGFFSLGWNTTFIGADFNCSYNYSQELRKLVETADKFMVEASVFARF